MERILISACLLGRPVRYDGRDKLLPHPLLDRWTREGRLVPVCPEVLAGFPTPRPPAEIEPGAQGAKVLRGGAWTSRSRMASATYRNYFGPERRDVFAGFRTCALDEGRR